MTGQAHEELVLDGIETSMMSYPPLPHENPRIVKSQTYRGTSSACWRGYRGTWEIKENKLFLIRIRGKFELQEGSPLFAQWFSGVIKVPQRNILRQFAGGGAIYEQELHITINCGVVVESLTIDNRPPFSEESLFRIDGSWKAGIILDWHTMESHMIGEDYNGHPVFETTRTELGELLYQFKYRSNNSALNDLLDLAIKSISTERGKFDLVVPIPPSNPTRTVTHRIADGLAAGLSAPTSTTALTKVRATDELKSVTNYQRRQELLSGVFAADSGQMLGKSVLLVDDIYRSGATLEAATEAAYTQGGAKAVYAFAVTRTRIHR